MVEPTSEGEKESALEEVEIAIRETTFHARSVSLDDVDKLLKYSQVIDNLSRVKERLNDIDSF